MIAWINYINLSTVRMFERAKEVSVRKTTGAGSWQLVHQFLFEGAVLNALALAIAFGLFEIMLPFFELLTGKSLQISPGGEPIAWWLLPGVFILGTLFSGIYPAFFRRSIHAGFDFVGSPGTARAEILIKKNPGCFSVRCFNCPDFGNGCRLFPASIYA